jgi:aspartyl protease family protein
MQEVDRQMSAGGGRGVRRLGGWMSIAAWVLLLLLLTLIFSSVLDRRNNPNRSLESRVSEQGIAEVILKRNPAGHYVASGTINGVPVVFLLDTGATDVALSPELADRLGLEKRGRAVSRTANGKVYTWQSLLREVGLGGIRLNDIRASILPGMKGDEVLLGMSFLKRLEMIQRGDELTLRSY